MKQTNEKRSLWVGFYNYTVIATFAGLVGGVFGIFCSLAGQPLLALGCLMFCGVVDMFDGKIAKTRKRTEPEKRFGIQIDSLSDLICFGVLPACIGYALGMKSFYFGLFMAAYVLAALIRLAYFNVTEEQRQQQTSETRRWYEGLPVTSCTLIFPLVYLLHGRMNPLAFTWVWAGVMLCVAGAFLWKFPIPKPGMKGMIGMMGLGIVELVLLCLFAK